MIKLKLKKIAGSKSEDFIVVKGYDIPKIILRGKNYIGVLVEGMEFQIDESLDDMLYIMNGWENLPLITLKERMAEISENKIFLDSIQSHRIDGPRFVEVQPAEKKPLLERLAAIFNKPR